MSQRPSKLRIWWQRQGRPAKIVIGCIGIPFIAIVLFVCSAATAGVLGLTGQPTPTAVLSTPTSAQQAHTTKPTPTAKPKPAPTSQPAHVPATNGPAVLGGTLGAFVAKYGQPNDHTQAKANLYHFQRHAGSNIDFLIIMIDTGTQKVINITAQASDVQPAGWSTSQATTICSGFFPPDAVYQSQVTLSNGTGYDKIYYSASLANVFPASEFSDASQNPVKPGTFDVQYLTKSNNTIDSCNILPGTSQTQ